MGGATAVGVAVVFNSPGPHYMYPLPRRLSVQFSAFIDAPPSFLLPISQHTHTDDDDDENNIPVGGWEEKGEEKGRK